MTKFRDINEVMATLRVKLGKLLSNTLGCSGDVSFSSQVAAKSVSYQQEIVKEVTQEQSTSN